jgi:EAL domain-containing protein (putative c-di-GMP-specific phosphodiesterase class I)
LYPAQFLDVVKGMGECERVTLLAVKNACRIIKQNNLKDLSFSINISTFELKNNNFCKKLASIIDEAGIDTSMIEFEILEDELIKNFDLINSNIYKLKELGVKFAIDDFGSGYSSIRYLQKLPVDTLKIDRYFMINSNEEANREIIKIVIGISRTFGLTLVVEGVEKKEHFEYLKEQGADMSQGFYFNKAIKESQFLKLLNS